MRRVVHLEGLPQPHPFWRGNDRSSLRSTLFTLAALAFFVATAGFFRFANLDRGTLWVDEAESSINGLTILQHGVPVDSYLGQPIYENTLVDPWPESDEYAFRDSSYSAKGVAVYHGWLPLYTLAGSHWLFGIAPDEVQGDRLSGAGSTSLVVRNDPNDRRWRNLAARTPMALVSTLTVVVAWAAARSMAGRRLGPAAGWAAAATFAISPVMVEYGRYARYFALTVLFMTLTVWALYLLWRDRRRLGWGVPLWTGLCGALLFHTHLMSTFVAGIAGAVVSAAVLASALREKRLPATLARLGAAAGLAAALTLPWLVLTGFLDATSSLPGTWRFLELPGDLISYPWERRWYALLLLSVVAMVGLLAILPTTGKVTLRMSRAARLAAGPVLVLLLTSAVGYVAFSLLMPVASYTPRRLTMMLSAPTLLILSVGAAVGVQLVAAPFRSWSAGRLWARRLSPILAATAAAVLLWNTTESPLGRIIWYAGLYDNATRTNVDETLELLEASNLPKSARIYATSNDHLTLTYYGGIPVQSITPIRPGYIEAYPGEVWICQLRPPRGIVDDNQTIRVAAKADQVLTSAAAAEVNAELTYAALREDFVDILLPAPDADALAEQVAFDPSPQPLSSVGSELQAEWHRLRRRLLETRTARNHQELERGSLLMRGFDVDDNIEHWWRLYFSRFSGVEPPYPPVLAWVPRLRDDPSLATVHLLREGGYIVRLRSAPDPQATAGLTPR